MKRKLLSILLAAAVVCTSLSSGFVTEAAPAAQAAGTTYYVSTLDGNDNNSGTSEDQAFYSLEKINNITLQPGDQVLLENGSVFVNEALHIQGSGSAAAPILISNYGDASKGLPRIDTNGQGIWYQNYRAPLDSSSHVYQGYVSSAVLLYDVEYITVENLEITNNAPKIEAAYNASDVMNRTGVAAVAQNIGTVDSIHLNNLYVHDVIGNVYDKHMNNGGIYFTCFTPMDSSTGIAKYDDVLIENCYVENVNRWGIAVGYSYTHTYFTAAAISDEAIEKYGSTNVVIRNNYVKEPGGDAITLMYCDRPLVEYNVADGTARQINDTDYANPGGRGGKVAAGIWPWKCKDAVFQYNEAFDTYYNQDGQAWDADSGDGTIYQYNYSHNNGGGSIMFCYPQSINNIFRYNISQNDLAGINPCGNPDAHIYNNVFYMKEGVSFIRRNMSGGGMLVENNIIYYSGDSACTEDWYLQTTDSKVDYMNNLYYNYANVPEEDTAAVVVEKDTAVFKDPGTAPTAPAAVTAGAISTSIVHDKTAFAGYELADNSPAIDAGKVIADNGGLDFLGNTLNGTTPDIGAIDHDALALTLESEVYKVDYVEKVISEVSEGTTVAQFLANMNCNADGVKVLKGTTEVTSGNVEAGMKLVMTVDGVEVTYTIAGITAIVKLSKTNLILNENAEISGTLLDTITWTMSEEGIIRINQKNNTIRAIGGGTTTLTATFANGTVKTFEITVVDTIVEDIPREEFANISITANTEEAGGEGATNGYATAAIDGDGSTFWHTAWSTGSFTVSESNPAVLTINLGAEIDMGGFKFQQRNVAANGLITQFSYQIKNAAGEVVASADHLRTPSNATSGGSWASVALKESVKAQIIVFSIEEGGNGFGCLAEIEPIRVQKMKLEEEGSGDVTPPIYEHVWGDWKTKSEATVFAAKEEVRKCSECGEEETRTVGTKLKATITTNAKSNKITLKKNQKSTGFRITGLAKGDSIVKIETSNKKVVNVSNVNKAKGTCTLKAGKLTGKKGKATITIKLKSGLKKVIKVTVQSSAVKTTSITGLDKKLTLKKGRSLTLKPVLVPFTSQDKVKFTSSKKSVVTVSSKGQIKAKKKGTATITVKAGKKTAKVKVTVK